MVNQFIFLGGLYCKLSDLNLELQGTDIDLSDRAFQQLSAMLKSNVKDVTIGIFQALTTLTIQINLSRKVLTAKFRKNFKILKRLKTLYSFSKCLSKIFKRNKNFKANLAYV